MRGFLEKWGDGDRQKRDRDETEFIGPNPPLGVGPKNAKNHQNDRFHIFWPTLPPENGSLMAIESQKM